MHNIQLFVLALSASLILAACQMGTLNLPDGAQKGPHSDSYTYRLDNGLKVILWPNSNSHSNNEASLHLVIHSGSLQETEQQLGYAHFVEHMAFNQTDELGHNPINEGLQALNLDLSVHANAYTTYDHTRYFMNLPDASFNRINTGLSLLARFAYQAPLKASEVVDEIGVVREEWRRSEPEKQNYQYQHHQLELTGSRHKNRPTIGTLESIEAVNVAALESYYQAHYRPGNASLIVTGDIDVEKTIAAIKEQFSPWVALHKDKGKAKAYPQPPIRQGTFDVFEDVNQSGYFVWLGNAHTYTDYGTPEGEYRSHITHMVMNMLNQRMQKLATQQNNSLSNLVAGFYGGQGHYADLSLGLQSQPADLEQGVKLLASVVNDLQLNGFSQVELDNSREGFLVSERVQQDGATHLSNIATDYVTKGAWLRNQKHYLALLEDRLPQLTLAKLNAHARSLFKTPHKIGIISQPGELLTDEAQVRGWVEAGKQLALAPLPTQEADEAIDWRIDHPAGQIVSQQEFSNGIHQLVLSNGIKVNYRYSDSAPGKVYMSLLASGGLNALSHQEVIDTRLGLTIIGASGLQHLDGHALSNWFDAQAMTLQPVFNLDSRGFYLDGPVNKVDALLKTLHVALQDARVDPALYSYYIPQFEQSIRDMEALEYVDYLHETEQVISQGHPAHRSLTIAELNSVRSENMQRIYEQYIAGAQDYTLHIVGDMPLDALLPDLQTYIASLPPNGGLLTPKASLTYPTEASIKGYGNPSKAATINYYLQIKQDSNPAADDKPLGLLSKQLTQYLSLALREELGLTYSVQANLYHNYAHDPVITLGVHLQCDPQKVDQVLSHIETLLAKLNQTGIEQTKIDQNIATLRQDFINEQHKAKFLLQQMTHAQLYKVDLANIFDAEKTYPDTLAKVLDDLLNAFINKSHGQVIAVLNP